MQQPPQAPPQPLHDLDLETEENAAQPPAPAPPPMQAAEAQTIGQAYGAVLGENTAIGVVRDIRSLPYSKPQIKAALQIALNAINDPMMEGHLIGGYVSLADFQDLSDEQIKALREWDRIVGKGQQLNDLETASAAATIAKIGKVVSAIHERVTDESTALAKELKTLGF